VDTIEAAITQAERRWPALRFRRKNYHEASSACPFGCGADEDGFLIFDDMGFWCRTCGTSGRIAKRDPNHRLTPDELNEIRLRRVERMAEENARRITALERMAQSQDHITYHKMLDASDRQYWHSQGITDAAIDKYLLGICYNCPTDREHRPSYTIPVINGGKLVNIRHRIIGASNGNKYRPHRAGLGTTLMNADLVYSDTPRLMIVEGAKKSIVVTERGFPAVGTMGKCGFKPNWAQRFERFKEVIVALDPDAQEQAEKLARLFGSRGRVLTLPLKPDDFFTRGGTALEFRQFMRYARRVN
jgi:hypothetical protein